MRLVNFRKIESRADDRMLVCTRPVLNVGGCDDRAVIQLLDTRVSTVIARVAVQQLHPALSGLAVLDVCVSADPRDEMPSCFAAWSLIAKRDDPTTIGCVYANVSVTGEPPGRVVRCAPCFAFVARKHHEAPARMCGFSHQTAQFGSVG